MTRRPWNKTYCSTPPLTTILIDWLILKHTNKLQDHFKYYASVKMMQYCNHPHDIQTNEALNQAIANMAPKSICYSGSISLISHIAIVIGVHNLGLYIFFEKLFEKVRVQMTKVLAVFLHAKQKRKENKQTYQKRLDVKARQSKSQKKRYNKYLWCAPMLAMVMQ
jgi:hypothetical protein